MNWLVGISTLPPMWPHFFSEASWSSKCTPAAPASIMRLHQLVGVERPAEAGLGVGHDRARASRAGALPSACSIWSARSSAWLMRLHDRGDAVGRVEALVRVHRPGQVGVGRDLPAGEVDRP